MALNPTPAKPLSQLSIHDVDTTFVHRANTCNLKSYQLNRGFESDPSEAAIGDEPNIYDVDTNFVHRVNTCNLKSYQLNRWL